MDEDAIGLREAATLDARRLLAVARYDKSVALLHLHTQSTTTEVLLPSLSIRTMGGMPVRRSALPRSTSDAYAEMMECDSTLEVA